MFIKPLKDRMVGKDISWCLKRCEKFIIGIDENNQINSSNYDTSTKLIILIKELKENDLYHKKVTKVKTHVINGCDICYHLYIY